MFSCEFCKIFKNTFFMEHLRVTKCFFLFLMPWSYPHRIKKSIEIKVGTIAKWFQAHNFIHSYFLLFCF